MTLPDIAPLLARYDAFLVDQFGTLHDGVTALPGAIAALRRMREAGRRVALLSNSGKPAAVSARRLERLGFTPDLYDVQLTSGEAAMRLLAQEAIPAARGRRRCLLLERDGDGAMLATLGLEAARPETADLVVIAGSEGDRRPIGWYEELLAGPARRGVPALCLNPDRTMLTPGGLAFGAGQIAERYVAMGGTITWIGKPHRAIYDMALAELGHPAPARVAGIGDSVEHDIAGAHAAGCAAFLVRSGIIAGWDEAAIAAECDRRGAAPDGMLAAFR